MTPQTVSFDNAHFMHASRMKFYGLLPNASSAAFRGYPAGNFFPMDDSLNNATRDTFYRHCRIPYTDGAFELENVQVFDNWGVVRTSESGKSPLYVPGFGWNRSHTDHLVQKGFLTAEVEDGSFRLNYDFDEPKTLTGTTCLLSFPGGLTYGHWFFDVVGRFLSVPEYLRQSIDTFLLPAPRQDWMDRFISVLGISKSQIKLLEKSSLYNCETLIVPTVPSQAPGGVVSHGVMRKTLSAFKKQFDAASDASSGDKVDVAVLQHTPMTSDPGRVLSNLQSVTEALKDESYEVVSFAPSKVPFSTTLEILGRARLVIGQDSSALHNLTCVPRDLIVIQTERRLNMLHSCVQVSTGQKLLELRADQQNGKWVIDPQKVLNAIDTIRNA